MKNVVRLRRWLICRCLIKHRPGECRLVKLCWLILLTCNMSYTGGIYRKDMISFFFRFSNEQSSGDARESPTKEALVSAINIFSPFVFCYTNFSSQDVWKTSFLLETISYTYCLLPVIDKSVTRLMRLTDSQQVVQTKLIVSNQWHSKLDK